MTNPDVSVLPILLAVTLIMAVGLLLNYLFREKSPALRLRLLRFVILVSLVLPLYWIGPDLVRIVLSRALTGLPASQAPAASSHATTEFLLVGWGGLCLFAALRTGALWLREQRVWSSALPAPPSTVAKGRQLSVRLGVTRPQIRISTLISKPQIRSLPERTILVPAAQGAPRHDLLPLARGLVKLTHRDELWKAAAGVMCVTLFFHPFAHLIRRAHKAVAREHTDRRLKKLLPKRTRKLLVTSPAHVRDIVPAANREPDVFAEAV